MSTHHTDYSRHFYHTVNAREVCVQVVTRDNQGEDGETTDYEVVQALQAILRGDSRVRLCPPPTEPVHAGAKPKTSNPHEILQWALCFYRTNYRRDFHPCDIELEQLITAFEQAFGQTTGKGAL